jgi:hypothetical protein
MNFALMSDKPAELSEEEINKAYRVHRNYVRYIKAFSHKP